MKYTIDVSGKGGEAFIFKLSKEQYEFLQDSGVEDDLMKHDDIYKTLEIEDYMDTNDIVSGLYNGSEYIMITVTDESGEVVWQSDDDFEFEDNFAKTTATTTSSASEDEDDFFSGL